MALEILSSRLLAPHFGNSVYVWGSIIGIFLGALSIGYVVGGQVADRAPSMEALGQVVVVIAIFLALLMLTGERLAAWLGQLTGGAPSGTLLAAGLLFGPVSILLGMVSPFAVRLAARDLEHLGNTAGRLYALSTAGSLVGTLGATFLMIPFLQLRQMFGLLLGLTAITAITALAGAPKKMKLAFGTAILLLGVAVPSLIPMRTYGDAVYKRITPYQTLQVLERDGIRYLRSDNITHAGVLVEDGSPALSYTALVSGAFLLNDEIESVLALGMGAGDVGKYLRGGRPDMSVEFVEIDPAVPQLAQRFFGFREGDGVSVHVADARRFLESADRQWDYIFCDTYIGLSVPFHLSTFEFFDLVEQRLTPDGVLGINLAGGVEHPFSKAIYRTVAEHFPTLYVFQARRSANVVLFAHRSPVMMQEEELVERGSALDAEVSFPLPLAILASRRVGIDLELSGVTILRDRFAPVERLIALQDNNAPR